MRLLRPNGPPRLTDAFVLSQAGLKSSCLGCASRSNRSRSCASVKKRSSYRDVNMIMMLSSRLRQMLLCFQPWRCDRSRALCQPSGLPVVSTSTTSGCNELIAAWATASSRASPTTSSEGLTRSRQTVCRNRECLQTTNTHLTLRRFPRFLMHSLGQSGLPGYQGDGDSPGE